MNNILKINRKSFTEKCLEALGIVNKKSPINAITNFLIKVENNVLSISATDLEIFTILKLTIENHDGNFSFLIKAHTLCDLLKKSSGEFITFTHTDKLITFTDSNGEFSLLTSNDNFPAEKTDGMEKILEINENFLNLLNNTSINIDTIVDGFCKFVLEKNEDSFIFFINGDKKRISIGQIKLDEIDNKYKELRFSISTKGRNEIVKFLSKKNNDEKTSLFYSDRQIALQQKNSFIVIKLMQDIPILPNDHLKDLNLCLVSKVNTNTFKKAVEKALIISPVMSSNIKIIFQEKKVIVQSFDPTKGKCTFNCESNGEFAGELSINGQFVMEALEAIKTDEIELLYKDRNQKFSIKGESCHIIMPMRS